MGFVSASSGDRMMKLLLVVAVLLFLAMTLVLPLGALFVRAITEADGAIGAGNFIRYFATPHLAGSIINTVMVAGVTTVVTVPAAFLFAYGLMRTNIIGAGVFRTAGLVSLFAPTLMTGIALIYLFGNNGLLTRIIPEWLGWAGAGKHSLYGAGGIILGEILYTFPHVMMILMVSLKSADNRLYDAAESLGAGMLKKFLTVTLPGIKYGLISSVFVCFTLAFTDFGIPKVVGGNFNVLATDVYKQIIGQHNMNMGAAVGIVLLIPAVLSFIADRLLQRRNHATITARSVPYVPRRNRKRDAILFMYCAAVSIIMLLPVLTVLAASLIKVWPYQPVLTLSHYTFTAVAGGGWGSVLTSVLVALLSAVSGTVLVFAAALVAERFREQRVLRGAVYLLSLLPMAVPGLVIGLSFIFVFNASGFGPLPNPMYLLYGTPVILVLANIVHFFSVPFVSSVGTLKGIDREFDAVSESLGAPFHRTLRKVILPLSAHGIAETIFYFFVNAMVTVSAVIFIYSPDWMPAPVAIVNMDDAGDTAAAAAMSMLILIINLGARGVYDLVEWRMHRREAKRKGGNHDSR
jgi:iron(III) transport system permease protein